MRTTRGFRVHSSAVSVLMITALALVSSDSQAEPPQAWDQERVTQLTGELVVAVSALRKAERRTVPDMVGVNERTWKNYLDTLRGIETSVKQLDKKLKGGGGYQETLPTAKKIRMLVRDAEVMGAKFLGLEQTDTLVGPVVALLDELGPYYFEPSAGDKARGASQGQ